ncbi:hypothetical protein [Paenarthrobacter sp. NCHU4564]|uniref:hypothetical protein n=1 Tax=Paenarthrobacter sp. NCHU4564 TaxID=3451353 RepID=UPI003F97BD41
MTRRFSTDSNQPGTFVSGPRRRTSRALWLITTGLLAGVAGGFFAWRMMAPGGDPEPLKRRAPHGSTAHQPESTGTTAEQPEELLVPQAEPVEISTRMRPGEWTEESLQAHIEDYKQQIRDMGAAESEIVVDVERTEEGAAKVAVSWARNTGS